jgi:hypothetical protein
MKNWTGALIVVCAGAAACAQPALSIRFDNGLSEITVAPGSQVRVHVWTAGMPAVGTPIPWTTPPGTGQVGQYAGFLSAFFNLQGSSGSWSGATWVPPFATPDPFPPHASGSNFNGIGVGVGFGPPVTAPEFELWYATLTVGGTDVQLNTLLQPVSTPPQVGFEVGLTGVLPGMPSVIGSHFVTALNGSAVIHVPAPAGVALLVLGGVVAGRRRRVTP